MKQADLRLNLSAKRTRKREFLEQMDRVVPRAALIGLIESVYGKKSGVGRPPFALASMLRIHFLQQWFALSDPPMEEALFDVPLFRDFAQLPGRNRSASPLRKVNRRRDPKRSVRLRLAGGVATPSAKRCVHFPDSREPPWSIRANKPIAESSPAAAVLSAALLDYEDHLNDRLLQQRQRVEHAVMGSDFLKRSGSALHLGGGSLGVGAVLLHRDLCSAAHRRRVSPEANDIGVFGPSGQ